MNVAVDISSRYACLQLDLHKFQRSLLTRSLLLELQSMCQLGSTRLLAPILGFRPIAQQYKRLPVVRAYTIGPKMASTLQGENPTTLMAPLFHGHLRTSRSCWAFHPAVYLYLKILTPPSPCPPTAMLAVTSVSSPGAPFCVMARDLGVQVPPWSIRSSCTGSRTWPLASQYFSRYSS